MFAAPATIKFVRVPGFIYKTHKLDLKCKPYLIFSNHMSITQKIFLISATKHYNGCIIKLILKPKFGILEACLLSSEFRQSALSWAVVAFNWK